MIVGARSKYYGNSEKLGEGDYGIKHVGSDKDIDKIYCRGRSVDAAEEMNDGSYGGCKVVRDFGGLRDKFAVEQLTKWR